MKFIGIDLGSTTIKAGVLDLEQSAVSLVRSRPFQSPVPGRPAAHFEIEPDAVVRAVRELLEELGPAAGDCRGLVVCSQMGGVVITDGHGTPVTNYLSWRDQRALEP